MSHYLTIDQGNTRTKVTVLDECGRPVCRGVYDSFDIETLVDNYGGYTVAGIIYSTVSRMDVRLIESIRHTYPELLEVLTHRCDTGVAIDYATPDTLGSDRVAAAAGAKALYPAESVLIVDAGTAITIDIVDAGGCFRGGNISAGISLRTRVLHSFTAALPDILTEGETPIFGHDTETALRSGAVMGAAWEIEGAYNAARAEFGCTRILLTGGDATLIATKLNLPKDAVEVQPDLVAIGLYNILRHIQQTK